MLIDGCHATGEGALHIHQLSSKESSPAWPETLLSDDEDDPPTYETCKSTEVSESDVCVLIFSTRSVINLSALVCFYFGYSTLSKA